MFQIFASLTPLTASLQNDFIRFYVSTLSSTIGPSRPGIFGQTLTFVRPASVETSVANFEPGAHYFLMTA